MIAKSQNSLATSEKGKQKAAKILYKAEKDELKTAKRIPKGWKGLQNKQEPS